MSFLKVVAKAYPDQQLHIVVGNYSAHNHADVKKWLQKNPRIQLHFTPTHSSWMNLVESFFSIITRQAIRRASFTSVKQVANATRNDRCVPFLWIKTADDILAVANRKTACATDHWLLNNSSYGPTPSGLAHRVDRRIAGPDAQEVMGSER